MTTRLKISIISFLLFGFAAVGLSQEELQSPWKFNIEVMVATSRLREGGLQQQNKFGFSAELHAEYALSNDISLTAGIGYLNIGEKIIGNATVDIRYEETTYEHTYIYFPVGAKLWSGNYFVYPTIGMALNQDNTLKRFQETFDDKEIVFEGPIVLTEGSFNRWTYPFSLSFGTLIPLYPDFAISLSAKVFTSLNPVTKGISRNNRYSGFGISAGVHF